ncbi:hypothetical protein EVAR_103797_1 [Eumeta japonica]|uniref:Uncharacterized protein n=1 Tax=Eumeta variegata TaxID=151549 RepID=A0A4C1Z164_EUMVA|nr:hypothetical protein EVAR_103797_1 [Eumeta japonica]
MRRYRHLFNKPQNESLEGRQSPSPPGRALAPAAHNPNGTSVFKAAGRHSPATALTAIELTCICLGFAQIKTVTGNEIESVNRTRSRIEGRDREGWKSKLTVRAKLESKLKPQSEEAGVPSQFVDTEHPFIISSTTGQRSAARSRPPAFIYDYWLLAEFAARLGAGRAPACLVTPRTRREGVTLDGYIRLEGILGRRRNYESPIQTIDISVPEREVKPGEGLLLKVFGFDVNCSRVSPCEGWEGKNHYGPSMRPDTGSHVKLQCGLQLPKSDTGRRWERTGLVTFKVVMGGQSLLLFHSHLVDFYKLFHLDGKIVGRV